MKKKFTIKIIFLFFVIIFFFILSCKTNDTMNVLKEEELKGEDLKDFNEEIFYDYFFKHKFINSFNYVYKYFQNKNKFPLQKEKIFIFTFISLFYIIAFENSNNIDKDKMEDLFYDIYLNYNYLFKISKNKYILDYFFVLYFFVKGEYSTFIYRFNQNFETFSELKSELKNFIFYLVSYSYLRLYNINQALDILKNVNENLLKDKIILYINYFFYNNLLYSYNLFTKYENSEFYLKNVDFFLFKDLDPVKKENFENIKKFNYINFYKDVINKESLPYKGIFYKKYFFIGTFLSGLYVFKQNGELFKYFTSYNSNLISQFIRNFFIYDDKLYVVTYEGINEILVDGDNIIIRKNNIFSLKKNYNSLYENENYIIVSTHFNGVFIYNKKNKETKNILKNSICESCFIYKDILFVGFLDNGFSIYDLKKDKFIFKNILSAGKDIKGFTLYENKIFICSYRDGVYQLNFEEINDTDKLNIENIIDKRLIDYCLKIVVVDNFLYVISIKGGILKVNLKNLNAVFVNNFEYYKITDINYSYNIFTICTYEQGVYAIFGFF